MEELTQFSQYEQTNEKNWIKDAVKHEGKLRKKLHKKEGEKITDTEIDSELAKLKKKDKDKAKPGLQLSKSDNKKEKELILARTLRGLKEGANAGFGKEVYLMLGSGGGKEELGIVIENFSSIGIVKLSHITIFCNSIYDIPTKNGMLILDGKEWLSFSLSTYKSETVEYKMLEEVLE